MDRKAIANETLRILEQGCYEFNGARVDIAAAPAFVSAHPQGCFTRCARRVRRGRLRLRLRSVALLLPTGAANQ